MNEQPGPIADRHHARALLDSPAFKHADPKVREWLRSLLVHGERCSGDRRAVDALLARAEKAKKGRP